MVHVAKWKMNKVEALTDVLVNNPVIGIIDIGGIPASQLQQIRKGLPSGCTFIVTKTTLLKLALKKASEQKKHIEELENSLDGQRGIIASEINPFKLFQSMESTKIKAPARGGEMAPEDIMIKEGETPFKPGPIVGELQKAGFPAAIERGKVVIKKNKTIVEEGQRIPRDVAKMLTKLEIYPMTVGLTLLAGFEDGTVYLRDVLDVDVAGFIRSITTASTSALNLAMFVGYPTKLTIRPLLQNAHQKALSLSFNAHIPTSESIVLLLSKAQGQALSLASHLPDIKDEIEKEKGAEEPKEEKEKVEKKEGVEETKEKKEEVKKEEGAKEPKGKNEKAEKKVEVEEPKEKKEEVEKEEGKEEPKEKKEKVEEKKEEKPTSSKE